MRLIQLLAALATIVGGASTRAAALQVAFEGTLSQFDAGYESLLSPGEHVRGSYTIPLSAVPYEIEIFGVTVTSRRLSEFSLVGESGWEVTVSDGVLAQQSSALMPGGLNNPLLQSHYFYSARGGQVSMPAQSSLSSAMDGDDVDDGGGLTIPQDLPDFAPLPILLPTVWNPVIELAIAGPSDLWDLYGDSLAPPPLSSATSATIKLNVDVFVPMVGFQRRTATFNVTHVSVVPEPGAWEMGALALATWLSLGRRSTCAR